MIRKMELNALGRGRTWSAFEVKNGAITARGGAGPFQREAAVDAWIAIVATVPEEAKKR